jgi:SAM-dependent methyltransferase
MDVVFAFDLVEHLYDLPGFLRAALAALRPGGRLVMLTGDNQSWTARATRPRWWYASYPEHVVFPSWPFWRSCAGFAGATRIQTYASRGYRNSFKTRVRGGARLMAGVGNGLPLVGPDHHLLTLTKA